MIGNQDKKRAALKNKLSKLYNSDPEISYSMNVRSGIFRVAVSDEEVISYLDDKPIKSIRIEDLDDEIRLALEENPEEAAGMIVDELINAHKEGKLAMSNKKLNKEAKELDSDYEDKLSVITEKQLENAGPLYERQKEERKDISEKQLEDNSYKEYERSSRVGEDQKSITEKQLENRKNPNESASPRQKEERDSITDKQLESTSANSRRNDEKTDITEKQMEKDFRRDDIKGITERQLSGKEQNHDKELIRRISSKEEALVFAKKIANSVAKTINGKDLEKDSTIKTLKASVKNFSSQKKLSEKLAQIFEEKEIGSDNSVNLDMEVPEDLAGNILSDEEISGTYEAELIINALKSLVENPKFSDLVTEAIEEEKNKDIKNESDDEETLINEALDDIDNEEQEDLLEKEDLKEDNELLENEENEINEENEEDNSADIEDSFIENDEDEDGLVAVEGSLQELKSIAGKEDLEKIAFKYSRKATGGEIKDSMDDLLFECDEKEGTYRAIFIDSEKADLESEEVQTLLAKREKSRLDKVSSSLNKINVKAQAMPAGGGLPNVAPAGEMGGGGTTLPPGPADIGLDTPPVESFESGMENEGTEMEDISDNNEPSPPGTRCPVCGSDDVDVEDGQFECNNCNSNGEIAVSLIVKEWAGTLEDNEGEKEEESGEGEEINAEMPMPMAASVYKINNGIIKEAINSGKGYYNVGEHCPNCGSDNTEVDHVGNGKCFSCSQAYISKIAHKDGKFSGLTIWQPIPIKPDCPECMAKAISKKMAKKYPVKLVKKASTGDIKTDFPYEACVSSIAKRYGLNAVALSGDCAGKSLIECICSKMASANRYSQSLAIALASRLTEKDPMEECIEDHMRDNNKNLTIKEACEECEKLKKKALAEMPEQEEIEYVACQDMENEACFGMDNGGFGLSYDIEKFDNNDVIDLSDEDYLLDQINQLLEIMKEFIQDKKDGSLDEIEITLDDKENSDEEDSVKEIIEDIEIIDETYEDDEDKEDEDEQDDDNEEEDDDNNNTEFVMDENDNNEEDNVLFKTDEDKEEDNEEDNEEDDEDNEEEDEDNEDEDEDNEDEEEEDNEEEGEKIANANKIKDLDEILKHMSSKKIKRYSDEDVLKTADSMQINDILGDRKISDNPSEKEVEKVTSQDTKDVGKIQNKNTMGKEEKFDAKGPEVPSRGKGSTMGQGEEMPENKAKIPAGEGSMRAEDTTIDTKVNTEADGIVASKKSKKTKVASEKTIEDPKPLDQSKDLKKQKIKDKMEMGSERESGLTPDTLKEAEVPEDNQLMGPDESKELNKPSVPSGNGGMGYEEETVGTEVSVETKGTVIADMEAKIKEANVNAERIKLATNLAALELLDGEINQEEFDTEVSKLATSSVPTLKTLISRYQERKAKAIEKSKIARKEETVRDARSVGLETPFIIESKSNTEDLKQKLQGMFSLGRKIQEYEENK